MKWLVFFACAACAPAMRPAVVDIPPSPVQVVAPPPSSAPEPRPEPAHVAIPFSEGQMWAGHYLCAQGETTLNLQIVRVQDNDVHALFEFAHDPTGVGGSFYADGTYDPRGGTLTLRPGAWVMKAPNYLTVGLTGTVKRDVFEGSIDHAGCGRFSVQLVTDADED